MQVYRALQNPIITPKDVIPSRSDFEVIGTFNAGVTRLNNEIILLIRVAERPINNNGNAVLCAVYDQKSKGVKVISFDKSDTECDFSDSRVIVTPTITYVTSISHLRIARSKDGINFSIDSKPSIAPDNEYETYGIEDPRITKLDETYYINYSAISPFGINTVLISTKDFIIFTKHGNIFCPDNKDVAIFPEKIDGKYYALHRPCTSVYAKPEIWIAESDNLICWGNHKHFMGTRKYSWDNGRLGASAVPFKTGEGWVEIYHGATIDNVYCLGAVLLDEKRPWKILARSVYPIMKPETEYEIKGFFGNVIFNCGVLNEGGIVKIYYGAADTCIGYAEIKLEDIMDSLKIG